MKYVLSKAGLGATQAIRSSRQQTLGRKINQGTRGGNVVGKRPDGTPIYASERNRGRKKDIGGDSTKKQLAAAEKRIKALKKKGKDTSKIEAIVASIRSKL